MRRRERNCRQNAIKFLLIAYSVLLVLAYHSLAFTSTSPYSYSSSSSSSTILEISQMKQISRRWHLSLEASRQNSNAPDGQGGQGGQGGQKKPTNENQNDESQGTGSTDSGTGSTGSTGSFGRISEKTIEEIKTYADIVTVIESHNLPLFSRSGDGNRATCVCPFHNDRNPSMNIDNEKGIYKCFSCGAGGDVFNFVREFDYVSNSQKGKKMSYPASIHKVAKEFCGEDILRQMPNNGSAGEGNGTGNGSIHSNKPLTPEKKVKLEEKRKQRERILLANSVAADYYAKMLITSPSAGIARSHLHQRGATPTMVRTFGIGFASDAYYNNNNNASGKGKGNVKAWGEGSLVEHLKEWEFTTQEILDAGLATVTSSAKKRLNMAGSGSFASSSSGKVDETTKSKPVKGTEASKNGGRKEEKSAPTPTPTLEYRDLMDRFKGRLMVPIFDESGKHVIGFGGRHLETAGIGAVADVNPLSSFKAAKYINSPESQVFSKKNVLFGLHAASAALITDSKQKQNASPKRSYTDGPRPAQFESDAPSIVMVEGYFDAITLFGAGIKETVATMGTALTMSQMQKAATAIGGGGRLVLCLDNDEAGITATERVCTGSSMWGFVDSTGVDIYVASLPDDIKDPAEFIEGNGGVDNESSEIAFRKDVLGEAVRWDDWYVSRLISKYNPNESTSFSEVCDKVSTFLSTHPNAAERTKRAYDAAGKLSDYISRDNGTSSGESRSIAPLRIQLESDLLGMASRKAAAREAMTRRIEAVNGGEGDIKTTIARMNSGEGSSGPKQIEIQPKPSKSPVTKSNSPRENREPKNVRRGYEDQESQSQRQYPQRRNNDLVGRRFVRDRPIPPQLSQHFSGFRFNDDDAAWLGIHDEKSSKNFVLGEVEGEDKKKEHVYFNSNEYLGNQRSVLSDIASSDKLSPTISKSNSLMEPDANRILLDAEYRLLHTMVHFSSARLAMKSALANRIDDGNTLINWSNLEREWLFDCLTDSTSHDPLPDQLQDGGTILQLKQHLMDRQDAPHGAFIVAARKIEENDTKNRSMDGETIDAIEINVDPMRNSEDALDESDNLNEKESLKYEAEILDPFDGRKEPGYSDEDLGGTSKNPRFDYRMGSLDPFFEDNEELSGVEIVNTDSMPVNERAELIVQDTVAIMLKATAIKRLNRLKNEYKVADNALKQRIKSKNDEGNKKEIAAIEHHRTHEISMYESLDDDELRIMCSNMGQKVLEAMTTARELTNSAQKLQERLLRYSTSNDAEGRISENKRKQLFKLIDEHMSSLPDDPRPDTPGDSGAYIFGSDEYNDDVGEQFGGRVPNRSISNIEEDEKKAKAVKRQSLLNYDSIFE